MRDEYRICFHTFFLLFLLGSLKAGDLTFNCRQFKSVGDCEQHQNPEGQQYDVVFNGIEQLCVAQGVVCIPLDIPRKCGSRTIWSYTLISVPAGPAIVYTPIFYETYYCTGNWWSVGSCQGGLNGDCVLGCSLNQTAK
uniref:Uncharacterized protein n=1 Tax=Paramoeba aestuarina TaxID=180227 RepID=A0A7S4KH04_9EUKA|mmetsp:Transcript_18648/g.29233  ORF Transcript_18648/g.29233 Transcript_18648/m.29233 type:complete len:138 (+) Transcript_18648:23-436(+)